MSGNLISRRLTVYSQRDSYGNAGRTEETVTDADGAVWRKTIDSVYLNNESAWILGKPTSVSVTRQAPDTENIVKTSSFEYNIETGFITREIKEPNHPLSLTTDFFYDQSGQLVKTIISDQSGDQKTSQTLYDDLGRPENKINALEYHTTIEYDPLCGLPTRKTDPNGLSVQWLYDGFCRMKKKIAPDGRSVEFSYQWSLGDAPAGESALFGAQTSSLAVYMIDRLDSAGVWSRSHRDSLGREIRAVTLGDGGKKVLRDTIYNALGRVKAASHPYFADAFSGDADDWITSQYDALGRLASKSAPFENSSRTTTFQYAGLKTNVFGPDGQTRVEEKNAAGKTISVKENNDSLITYKHDAAGNLAESDANGYITQIYHDEMGRKRWLDDPASGRTEYSYNAFGELIWQKDSEGHETVLEYDALGRLIKRLEPEGESTWTYEVDRLSWQTDPLSSRHYVYDQYGRLYLDFFYINGRQFVTKYQYDENGRLKVGMSGVQSHLVYNQYDRTYQKYLINRLNIVRSYSENGRLKEIKIPKSNVVDYDYQQLVDSLKEVEEAIQSYKNSIVEYDRQAAEYLKKAAEYRQQANEWGAKSAALYQEAESLRQAAARLEKKAEEYRTTAAVYRVKSNYYWTHYGNLIFVFQGVAPDGAFLYKSAICIQNNWKGNCRKRDYFNESIPSSLLMDYPGNTSSPRIGEIYDYQASAQSQLAQVSAGEARGLRAQAGYKDGLTWRSLLTYHSLLDQAAERSRLSEERTELRRQATNALENKRTEKNDLQARLDGQNMDGEYLILWMAGERDAAGRLKKEIFGNRLVTAREFNPGDGLLNRISTDAGDDLIRDLNYDYDPRGNVVKRDDALSGVEDTFSYDLHDRLDYWERVDPSANTLYRDYAYDSRGNMTMGAGDIGEGGGVMEYDEANRLETRTSGAETYSYNYDQKGNRLNGDGKTFQWTSFGKIKTIEDGQNKVEFFYGPNRRRLIKKSGNRTVYYPRPGYEVIIEQNAEGRDLITTRHHIFVNGRAVAVYEKSVLAPLKKSLEQYPDKVAYLHGDALGSVDTVTDEFGDVVLKNRYTPFGERLETEQPAKELFKAEELRGYTGHEHIAEAGLINMNARIYDPMTMNFLSPDSIVPYPKVAFSHNRYMYVHGNPLKYTDPSGNFFVGFFLFTIFAATQMSDDPMDRMAGQAGLMMYSGGVGLSGLEGAAGVMADGAIVGFTTSTVNSDGNLDAALRGAAYGALAAGVTYGVNAGLTQSGSPWYLNAPVRGIAQGLVARARGGDFQQSFMFAAGFSLLADANLAMKKDQAVLAAKNPMNVNKQKDLIGGHCFTGSSAAGRCIVGRVGPDGETKQNMYYDEVANFVESYDTAKNPAPELYAYYKDMYDGGATGGWQGQGQRMFLGAPAPKGSLTYKVMSYYAPHHDWLGDAAGAYDQFGDYIDIKFNYRMSILNVFVATPIVFGAAANDYMHYWHAYKYSRR